MTEVAAPERREGQESSPPRTTLLLLAFAVTRILVVLIALNPDAYEHGLATAADRDVLYRSWSSQVLDEGLVPYAETNFEYPPGSLPFLILPGLLGTELVPYRLLFVLMMLVVDAFGLIACLRISRRWGNAGAPWLWVVLVGLLGPLAYARFDLVPAVMTAWSLERAAAARWGSAGGWMAAAGVAKLYAFILVPLAFVASPDRKRFTWSSVAVVAAAGLPFVLSLGSLWRDVGGYHLSRGIHVESLAGSILFIASRQGLRGELQYGAGALHFTGDVAEGLRLACDLGVLVALAAGLYVALRMPRDNVSLLAAAMLGTLSLAMVASPVLSPQFILWIVPLGVAAVAAGGGRGVTWTLVGITGATMAIFPFLYLELAAGQPLPVILLWGRNLALLGLGLLVLRRVSNAPAPTRLGPRRAGYDKSHV